MPDLEAGASTQKMWPMSLHGEKTVKPFIADTIQKIKFFEILYKENELWPYRPLLEPGWKIKGN